MDPKDMSEYDFERWAIDHVAEAYRADAERLWIIFHKWHPHVNRKAFESIMEQMINP